jgi:glycosyl hydrolase family 26
VVSPAQAAIGVYTGPAGTAEHDGFSAWLGNEATYALDFVDDAQTWANIASHSDWLLDPWASWVTAKAGRRMVISVPMLNQASSGRLADGAAGAFDAYFRTLAQEIVDKGLGNAIIRLGWEANGDWYPWKASTDPAAWKAFFRRIVGVFRCVQPTVARAPRQAFEFLLTYNRGTSATAIRFATIYPGDDVVDILGIDVFDHKWMDETSPPEVRWDEVLHQEMGLEDFRAFAALRGKPMSIPEWGLAERGYDDNGGAGDNPYFVDRMADWLDANAESVRFQSYFDHLSAWTGDHRLASYPHAQARYRARFGP